MERNSKIVLHNEKMSQLLNNLITNSNKQPPLHTITASAAPTSLSLSSTTLSPIGVQLNGACTTQYDTNEIFKTIHIIDHPDLDYHSNVSESSEIDALTHHTHKHTHHYFASIEQDTDYPVSTYELPNKTIDLIGVDINKTRNSIVNKKSVRFNENHHQLNTDSNQAAAALSISLPSSPSSKDSSTTSNGSCLICCRPTSATNTITNARLTSVNGTSPSPNINIKSIVLSCNCCSCTYRVLPSQLCVACCRCCCSSRSVTKTTTTSTTTPIKTSSSPSKHPALAASSASSLSTSGSLYSSSLGTSKATNENLNGIKTCENCIEHPALLNYIICDNMSRSDHREANLSSNHINMSVNGCSSGSCASGGYMNKSDTPVTRKQVKKGRNNELITVYSYDEEHNEIDNHMEHDEMSSERKKNEKRFYSSFLKLLRRHMNCASSNSSSVKSKTYSEAR